MHNKNERFNQIPRILDAEFKPERVKALSKIEMEKLSKELRDMILEIINKNGGHLSSNLGIVEATVSLYHNFDFSLDRLIFDVGHQCYAHKILSGRNNEFSTIRLKGGLSGFLDKDESEFDACTVGHAGTSLSTAIGMAIARDKAGEDYTVVAVVGDGAISNGLNFEALTASKSKPKNLIVILNDNGMSISKNKNGFYQLISRSTTKRGYLRSKRVIKKVFGNSFITRWLSRVRDFIKRVIGRNNYFEQCGFKYVGGVDGNNVKKLDKIIKRVKVIARDKAVFLHLNTTKGKGYKQAEERSDYYHGVSHNLLMDKGSFSVALGEKLNELINNDNKIVAITAGMKDGTGLSAVEKQHPENFYDVGIAEEYAVSLASGMALGGIKPVVAIYSTFMQRAYDQIVHDVCLQNLPVVFCLDRAGVVGQDGKTHQGVFDLSYLSHVPNLKIFAPNTVIEFKETLELALNMNCPVAIRYPKNSGVEIKENSIKNGFWNTVYDGDSKVATIITVGPRMLDLALKVAKENKNVKIISARSIKPLDLNALKSIEEKLVITLEENSVIGGFGSQVLQYFSENGKNIKVVTLGIKDEFVAHASCDEQLYDNSLTVENVINIINNKR